MPNPVVWVILPAYNGERFLPEALESVAQQTYPNWNLYLVDDGSQDRSPEICREFAERFGSRVRLELRTRNLGLRKSIQTFLRLAEEGDYLAFHAHDDVWHKDRLERAVMALERQPEASMSYSEGELIDTSGKATGQLFSDLCGFQPRVAQLARQIFFHGNCICGPTVTVRSSWVRRLRLRIPPGIERSTDYFSWLVLTSAAPAVQLESPTAQYRVSSEQLHRCYRATQREDLRIPRAAWKRYPAVRALASPKELRELERQKASSYFESRIEQGDFWEAAWWGRQLLVRDPRGRTVRRLVANLLQLWRNDSKGA